MITTEEKQSTAAVTESFDLVKGEYTPDEAEEIVRDLFTKKVDFHVAKGFSQHIRFGTDETATAKRIQELRDARGEAVELVQRARNAGRRVRVISTLSVEIL